MSILRFGISDLPPVGVSDEAFLDDLVEKGHRALELPFTKGFPWKEKRCEKFGQLAAERDLRLSVHAPYFVGLTIADQDRGQQSAHALEHTVKLGKALRAPVIVAHLGATHDEDPVVLMDRIRSRIEFISDKIAGLGVGLGLETAGKHSQFGSLGDIAQLAEEFPFVRPVVDWAHVHAITGGGLTTKEAFQSVLQFVRNSFPGWMVQPLQAQFSDTEFGDGGEIRHIPYGQGTLKIGPLIEAAEEMDFSMVVISEARDSKSHKLIWDEVRTHLDLEAEDRSRTLASADVDFPSQVRVTSEGERFVPTTSDRPITFSNVDKLFFPEHGYTKGDLIQYYTSVAPLLLPHLQGRPISMSRFPDGINGPSFYEKRAPGHQPDWMRSVPVPSDSQGGVIDFLLADSPEALMWFANMGCIEIHPFHSTARSLEHPSYAIFDFDPAEGSSWDQVSAAGRLLRVALGQLGLEGHPKVSGSKGLHVYVPLEPVHDFARVRRFVGEVGEYLAAANPDDITMEWDKPKRKGKVFIDHNRNASGQTVASVYSVRPLPGAPISTPLTWDEVGEVANGDYTITNIWERLQRFGDLFAPVSRGGQTLDEAEEKLGIA